MDKRFAGRLLAGEDPVAVQSHVQGIAKQLLEGPQPVPAPEEPGMFQKARSLVTGEGRTEFDIPELGTSGSEVPAFSEQGMKMAGAYASSADPEQIADIALKTLPGSERGADKYGNVIIKFNDKDYYVNKPGVSQADLFALLSQAGAFAPAAKFGAAGKTLGKRMVRTGLTSAGTSAGLDLAAEQLGSEQGVSGSRAITSGVAGGIFEGIGPLAVKGWRSIFGKPLALGKDGRLTREGARMARKAGLDPEDMDTRLSRIFAEEAAESVSPEHAAGRTAAREFDIRYTRGQTAGDFDQLAREEATRKGAFGKQAGDIMRQFDEEQIGDIATARARVQGELGQSGIEREAEGAANVLTGVQERARGLGQQVDRAYEAARGARAEFTGESLSDLSKGVADSVKDFGIDPILHPGSTKMFRELGKLSKEVKKVRKHNLKPLDMQKFETFRRKLNNAINGAKNNPADKGALVRMKSNLDGWMDDAVDNALFSGDDEALTMLKKARAVRREYGVKFEAQKGKFPDQPGKVMEKMIQANPTPEQAVNYLFGYSKLGKSGTSQTVMNRLKKAVGEDSGEWEAVREMAWLRLSKDAQGRTLSPTKFKTQFNEAMNQSKGLMDALYTKDELNLMTRYRDALLRTVTPEGATNRSQTAFTIARLVRDLTRRTGTMFTFSGQPGLGAAFFTAARTPSVLGARGARQALTPLRAPVTAPQIVAPATAGARQE